MSKGDFVDLIERDDDFDDGWYLGRHCQTCETGLFPQGEAFFRSLLREQVKVRLLTERRNFKSTRPWHRCETDDPLTVTTRL